MKAFLELLNRVRENEDDKLAFAAVTSGMQISNIQDKQTNPMHNGTGPNNATSG